MTFFWLFCDFRKRWRQVKSSWDQQKILLIKIIMAEMSIFKMMVNHNNNHNSSISNKRNNNNQWVCQIPQLLHLFLPNKMSLSQQSLSNNLEDQHREKLWIYLTAMMKKKKLQHLSLNLNNTNNNSNNPLPLLLLWIIQSQWGLLRTLKYLLA